MEGGNWEPLGGFLGNLTKKGHIGKIIGEVLRYLNMYGPYLEDHPNHESKWFVTLI